jgi:hypothetical protein
MAGFLSWVVYCLQSVARVLSLVLSVTFVFAGAAKQVALSKFIEDFYVEVLTPRYQDGLSAIGLGGLTLDWQYVKLVISVVEIVAGLLFLINYRKYGAVLALAVVLSGSKNVKSRLIHINDFGEFEIFPVSFIQGIAAALILLLPSGAKAATSKVKSKGE